MKQTNARKCDEDLDLELLLDEADQQSEGEAVRYSHDELMKMLKRKTEYK